MVRVAITFICWISLPLSIWTQQITFNKTYNLSDDYEATLGVLEVEDGYLLTQNSIGFTYESNDMYLGKIDTEGNLLWQRSYCTDSTRCITSRSALIENGNGNILVYGYTDSPLNNDGDAMIYEFTMDGDSVEMKIIDSDSLESFHSLSVLPDEGFIACGQSSTEDSGGDAYLVRMDSNYEVLWRKYFGGGGWQISHSVDQTPDGGFVMTGKAYVSWTQTDILLYKTDSLGQLEWERRPGGEGNNDGQHNVKVLKDSTILVTAARGFSSGNHVSYLAKYNMDGELIWDDIHFASTGDFFTTPAIELANGNLVVAGIRDVYNSSTNNYVIHGKITQFTAEGEPVWDHVYHGRPDIDNYFYGLIRTSDGGYLAHGSSYGPDNATLQDGWIVKMDSEGVACESLGCVLVNEQEVRAGNPQLVLSPNPASDYAYIDYRLPQVASNLHFLVLDSQGRQLWQYEEPFPSDTGSIGFSVAGWPVGLYLVQLRSTEGLVATQRLVVGL